MLFYLFQNVYTSSGAYWPLFSGHWGSLCGCKADTLPPSTRRLWMGWTVCCRGVHRDNFILTSLVVYLYMPHWRISISCFWCIMWVCSAVCHVIISTPSFIYIVHSLVIVNDLRWQVLDFYCTWLICKQYRVSSLRAQFFLFYLYTFWPNKRLIWLKKYEKGFKILNLNVFFLCVL